MIELIVAVALIWPTECTGFGDLYKDAALIRDRGRPLAEILKMTEKKHIRLALMHVYERPDMTAQAWYWMAVGICVGQKDKGTKSASLQGVNHGLAAALPDR